MMRGGRRTSFGLAQFAQVPLTLDEGQRAPVHLIEVVEGLRPVEALLDEEAEIFVELGRGGAREIVFAGGIVRLKSLFEGDALPCCLLSELFESFCFRDAYFSIAGAVDFVFREKMDEAALP